MPIGLVYLRPCCIITMEPTDLDARQPEMLARPPTQSDQAGTVRSSESVRYEMQLSQRLCMLEQKWLELFGFQVLPTEIQTL